MSNVKNLTLRTMLGNYPITQPLKSGTVRSDLIDFDFAEVKVANNLFKSVVRDAKYDVAEYSDPAFVKRAGGGKELAQMLLDGEIDAAVVGDKLPDPRLEHLIVEPEKAAHVWAERHGGVPINHMVVVRESLSRQRPDVVREVFRKLHESKRAAGLPEAGALDPYRFGIEACRPILEVIIDFCADQQLLPRRLTVDELFDDTTRALVP